MFNVREVHGSDFYVAAKAVTNAELGRYRMGTMWPWSPRVMNVPSGCIPMDTHLPGPTSVSHVEPRPLPSGLHPATLGPLPVQV